MPGPSTSALATPDAARQGTGHATLGLVVAGLLALFGPTWYDLLVGRYRAYAEGHEALVMAACLWLAWRQRAALAALPTRTSGTWPARGLFVVGLLTYLLGRTQQFPRVEMLSELALVIALLWHFKGPAALRLLWFPLAFSLFAIPLPFGLVLALTGPLKTAVSLLTTAVLRLLDYPVGRTGVVITVGQYQLLVAEACAGLQTMFALEAFGLLYTNLMNYRAWQRATLMAVMVVPVAFLANVVRTTTLVLVTYHFGDEVGQGFVHNFAGVLLFSVALLFIHALDRALDRVAPAHWR